MSESMVLRGDHAQIEIAGEDTLPSDPPLLVAAEGGFSCFKRAADHGPAEFAGPLVSLAEAIRHDERGAFVGLATLPGTRAIGFVQSDRGTFYENRNGHGGRGRPAWRDFMFRTTHCLLERIEQRLRAEEIAVHHIPGHGWPPGALSAFLEALGHFADGGDESRSLRRVYVATGGGCCLRDEGELRGAAAPLVEEQARSEAPTLRPYGCTEVPLDMFGDFESLREHVTVWQVDVDR